MSFTSNLTPMVNYLADFMTKEMALCTIKYLSNSKGNRLSVYAVEVSIISKLKLDYIDDFDLL